MRREPSAYGAIWPGKWPTFYRIWNVGISGCYALPIPDCLDFGQVKHLHSPWTRSINIKCPWHDISIVDSDMQLRANWAQTKPGANISYSTYLQKGRWISGFRPRPQWCLLSLKELENVKSHRPSTLSHTVGMPDNYSFFGLNEHFAHTGLAR